MKLAAHRFLEAPSERFFFGGEAEVLPRKEIISQLKKREFMALQADFPKRILPDLVWGQLRRYLRKSAALLEEADFEVMKLDLWSDEDKVIFLYELKELTLPKTKKAMGPPVADEENVKRFLEKKRKVTAGPYEENGRVVLEAEREKTSAKKVLEEFVKTCRIDEKEGLRICLRRAKVMDEKSILKHYKGHFAEHLTRYLQGKESFE
jgi:tRNA nucleotidyltransferase (CCA-adding enzyme)